VTPELAAAFRHCTAVVTGHDENFPVGSVLVSRRMRRYVHAVYAFARAADDFADEPEHEGYRLDRLDAWEARLDRCLAGRPEGPVFLALGETIRRFHLPDRPLRDLLDAFRQDCTVRRYARWDELLDYSRRSADPVGRIVLHLFGYRDREVHRASDAVCTALQLTNFWQDVAVDLRKDRIYLPEEDRRAFGVSEEGLFAGEPGPGYRPLIAALAARTRALFEEGRPLLRAVRGRLGLELRLVWLGGRRILDRGEAAGPAVFTDRPTLSGGERAALVARALLGAGA